MRKIKAIPYSRKICFKCLKESENIHEVEFGSLGYYSHFNNYSTILQLCEDCFASAPESVKEPDVLYDDENEERDVYKGEDEIISYFDHLPPEGQQFVRNECANNTARIKMEPQDWLDYYINKDLPYDKAHKYYKYALEEIDSYKDRFPTCEWPVEIAFKDASINCVCPFGASGKEGQKEKENVSAQCYQCPYYKKRESSLLRVTKEQWKEKSDLLKDRALKNKPIEIEILLSCKTGSDMPEIIKNAALKNREKIILRDRRDAVIDELRKCAKECDERRKESLLSSGKVIRYKKDGKEYFEFKEGETFYKYRVEKVDTTKMWTIKEDPIEREESIEYFDIVYHDEETNYYC